MAELIEITRDDVTLGGAMRKKGDTFPALFVPEGVRALIKAGEVSGAKIIDGDVTEQTVNTILVPPITMAYNPAGQAIQIHLPGPWGERSGTVVTTDVPEREETSPPVVVETKTAATDTVTAPSILDGTVEEITAAVVALDADDLNTLRTSEAAGKKRVGVLKAIDARLQELG